MFAAEGKGIRRMAVTVGHLGSRSTTGVLPSSAFARPFNTFPTYAINCSSFKAEGRTPHSPPPVQSLLGSSLRTFSSVAGGGKHEYIQVRRQDNVAVVQLYRPKALNALCNELCIELVKELQEIDKDDSIRAIVLTGNEKAFAAGADIKQMKANDYASASRDDMLAHWNAIQNIRKPIIAAVNGYALGGGCELAMMCDIIIAGDKAKFGQPEILLGTIPGMGGSQRLVRAVGKSKAMEWILTGAHFDAYEAEKAGLVSRVVEAAKLEEEAVKLAQQIASFSLPAIIAAKETVNRSFEVSLQEGLLFERRAFHSTFATQDRTEGMNAFVEKKQPVWKHR